MLGHVGARGIASAGATPEVIGRVHSAAIGTRVADGGLHQPGPSADLGYASQIAGDVGPVRPFGDKGLQLRARVLRALAAEPVPPFGGAGEHMAGAAIEETAVGAAAVAVQSFYLEAERVGEPVESLRVFVGAYEERAG